MSLLTRKKISDLLLGIAIGDAFGAGVEFQDRDWIRANVDGTKLVNRRATICVSKDQLLWFTQDYQSWDYTDDTEMTIGVLKALMSDKMFSEDLLVECWEGEYLQGKKIKGHGRNGHGSMRWYYEGTKTIGEIRDFQRNRPNPGNAPAMRAVPLGLLEASKANMYAAINAQATHPNINAIIASQCIAQAAAYLLVEGGKQRAIIQHCMDSVDLNEEYRSYLLKVDRLPTYDKLEKGHFECLCGQQPIQAPYFLSGINGVPSDSKYTTGAVLYVLKQSINAFDALLKAVWLGGDVDSIASITTGIMAGKDGIESLPPFMLDRVEGTAYLLALAKSFTDYLGLKQ